MWTVGLAVVLSLIIELDLTFVHYHVTVILPTGTGGYYSITMSGARAFI